MFVSGCTDQSMLVPNDHERKFGFHCKWWKTFRLFSDKFSSLSEDKNRHRKTQGLVFYFGYHDKLPQLGDL